MKVQAAVIREFGAPFEVTTLDMAEPADDEVLVKLTAVGICHSDIATRNGAFGPPLPVVLGHEGSGVVERVGAKVTGLAPGDHVVLSYASCGACPACSEHAPQYCREFALRNFKGWRSNGEPTFREEAGPVYGGYFAQSSFATWAIATQRNTVKVDKALPLELLGPLGCGLQTGSGTVINTLKPKPGESIVVFGVGTVGMAALMAAKAVGCGTIIAVDVHDGRLELAKELGATATARGDDTELAKTLRGLLPPGGANYTIDTSGRPEIIRIATEALAVRGTCVVLAVIPGKEATIAPGFLLSGRKLMGATEGDADPQDYIPEMLKLHAAGKFPFEKLVRFYTLDQINEAVADMHSGVTIKPILRL